MIRRNSMTSSLKRWALILAGAALIATMVAALAAAAIPHAAGHNKSRRYRSAKIAVAQTAAFSALSSNAPAATVPDAVTQMAATVGRDYGVDVAQTRAVTGPDGATWYLLPGTGGLCFYVSHLGGCGSWDNAVNGRLFIAALPNPASSAVAATAPPGASEVIGVAPNAISDVAANGDDTPVSSNVYRLKTTNATGFVLHGSGVSQVVTLGGR
jgi:hypothetical protein